MTDANAYQRMEESVTRSRQPADITTVFGTNNNTNFIAQVIVLPNITKYKVSVIIIMSIINAATTQYCCYYHH